MVSATRVPQKAQNVPAGSVPLPHFRHFTPPAGISLDAADGTVLATTPETGEYAAPRGWPRGLPQSPQ
jgi:hypothetical protein